MCFASSCKDSLFVSEKEKVDNVHTSKICLHPIKKGNCIFITLRNLRASNDFAELANVSVIHPTDPGSNLTILSYSVCVASEFKSLGYYLLSIIC